MTTARKPKNHIQESVGSKVFDVINVIIMLLLCFVTLYPMWYVLCASVTENAYLVAHPGAIFWPHGFTTGSYGLAFSHPLLLSGYKNILIVLLVSLPINIILTLFCGYVTASKNLMFKPIIQFLIILQHYPLPCYILFHPKGGLFPFRSILLFVRMNALRCINADHSNCCLIPVH